MGTSSQSEEETPRSISGTLAALKRAADADRISVGQMVDQLGQRTYGPLLFTIGLLALSPLGAIPGASVVCATLTILLAMQMSFGSGAPWVPAKLRQIEVNGQLSRQSIEWAEPYVSWLDRFTSTRLETLLQPPAVHLVVLALAALALLMYPLALIPWGVMPVAATLALLGLGVLTADGLIVAVGLGVSLFVCGGGLYFLLA